MKQLLSVWMILMCSALAVQAQPPGITVEQIATDLNNPRGVGVLPDGRLLVVEAGTGETLRIETDGSGRILLLDDTNSDGDYNDANEREPVLTEIPSYNSLEMFQTGHDEVFGLGDLAVLPGGEVFFTKDDPFAQRARGMDDIFYGDTGVFALDAQAQTSQVLVNRSSTVNGLAYDPARAGFYITESGRNQIAFVPLDGSEPTVTAQFEMLANGQEPVPSGVAVDPTTGDVLVSLFSGYLKDYEGMSLSFVPGDSQVMRVDPATGAVTEAVTGLTTAVDVTVDAAGNLYVAEMTRQWPPGLMPTGFDLEDTSAPPDPGGYTRSTGRVSMFPADGSAPLVLMDAVDTPASLHWHAGALYVSTGVGTPGRNVYTLEGIREIEGALYRVTGF